MISSVRSRIEHAFGFIEESLGGSVVRSIGLIRAKFNITLTSLVYNICRLGQNVRGGVRESACPNHYIDVKNGTPIQKIKNLTERSLRKSAGIVPSICIVVLVNLQQMK